MIPKIIHYCWFGRGKMPELAEHCLASWRKFLPDYELKLWNEDSFDVNRLRFTRQAYERRKFAFVTDYVRLYALKSFGGIYMDTDVEVLRSLDDLLGLPGLRIRIQLSAADGTARLQERGALARYADELL